MATFEINLNKVKEDLDALNQYIKNYKETISAVENTLSNADSFWNDFNTDPFIKTIKNDEKNFKNHINAISSYVDVIEKFCNDLKQCVFKYTGKIRVVRLKYNSMNVSFAMQDLNKAITFLNNALASLESANIPLTFKYRIILNLYERDLKQYIKTLSFSKITLENINRTMNGILSIAKTQNSRIEFKSVDNKKLGYKWQTFSSDLKQIEKEASKEHNTNVVMDNNNVNSTGKVEINGEHVNNQNNVIIEMLDIEDPVVMPGENVMNNLVNDSGDNINIQYSNDEKNFNQNYAENMINSSNIEYFKEEDSLNNNIGNNSINNTEIELNNEKDLDMVNGNIGFTNSNSEVEVNKGDIDSNINNQQFQNVNYEEDFNNKKLNEVSKIDTLE